MNWDLFSRSPSPVPTGNNDASLGTIECKNWFANVLLGNSTFPDRFNSNNLKIYFESEFISLLIGHLWPQQ